MYYRYSIYLFISLLKLICDTTALSHPDKVLELTSDNYESSTSNYQIVALNFYADWCPYSANWKPVFQETATLIYNATKNYDPNVIIFGQINCENQITLAQRFRVTKYPTTKLTLYGAPLKKEYRGARTVAGFTEYLNKYLADPIVYIPNHSDYINKIDESKGAIIIYSGITSELGEKPANSNELQIFRRVAQELREDCQFFYILNSASGDRVPPGQSYLITFKPPHKRTDEEIKFQGGITDSATLGHWAKEHCIPLIREITFNNAEELTESGLPFVLFFYDPNDKSWIEVYKKIVERELVEQAKKVTFLIADGHVFSHPLKHLGRTVKDLPLLAIDSFRHLFLYKKPIETIKEPGMIRKFIEDLHSGKLDREFHFGPDPTDSESPKNPAESAFNKLAPSEKRYSLLPRDEL